MISKNSSLLNKTTLIAHILLLHLHIWLLKYHKNSRTLASLCYLLKDIKSHSVLWPEEFSISTNPSSTKNLNDVTFFSRYTCVNLKCNLHNIWLFWNPTFHQTFCIQFPHHLHKTSNSVFPTLMWVAPYLMRSHIICCSSNLWNFHNHWWDPDVYLNNTK